VQPAEFEVSNMRAVYFNSYGGVETLEVGELPTPAPGPGQVLVKVTACGLNRLDLIVRSGSAPVKLKFPHVPGSEVAGVVHSLGAGVVGWEPGQRVVIAPYLNCGKCDYCLSGREEVCLRGDIVGLMSHGGYAEFVVAPASNLVPIPDGLGDKDAAAVTLSTLTAWHALVTRAEVKPGESVLVLAAGSGVGSAAIQIAKLAGAQVIATASTEEKRRMAEEIGADIAISYLDGEMRGAVRRISGRRGVDVVFEHVGGATWERSVSCLARNGRLVICGTTSGTRGVTDLWGLFAKQLNLLGTYGGTRAELARVLSLTAQGKLKAVIDGEYPLEQAGEAQERLKARRQFGKILLIP
jgi:NADPH:quinone reductase-like Zn-dependent oxidoreductase